MVVVSFPAASLGGGRRGMGTHHEERFRTQLAGRARQLERALAQLGMPSDRPHPALESLLLRGLTTLGFAWFLFGSAMALRSHLLLG